GAARGAADMVYIRKICFLMPGSKVLGINTIVKLSS
ncbi:hypothetical protein A2U01_0108050, partial [Trifolium medium]|nr:hypothetical protein [Trifolium medium]